MIVTHRRLNIGQAFKMAGDEWVTMEKLRASGAYGSQFSIHRSIRLMMLKWDAASMARVKVDGVMVWIYRVPPEGMVKLGLLPTRGRNDD